MFGNIQVYLQNLIYSTVCKCNKQLQVADHQYLVKQFNYLVVRKINLSPLLLAGKIIGYRMWEKEKLVFLSLFVLRENGINNLFD